MPNRHHNSGLSLIEIIIVLAIGAIMVSLAIPTYNNIMLESRRKDAQVSLLEMQQAIELIRLEYGSLKQVEIDKLPEISSLKFYALAFEGDSKAYNITASPIGAQTEDNYCADFILDNLGQKQISGDGEISECWD